MVEGMTCWEAGEWTCVMVFMVPVVAMALGLGGVNVVVADDCGCDCGWEAARGMGGCSTVVVVGDP